MKKLRLQKKADDGALNNLEEEIQRLEKLKQQGEATQASESMKDTVSDTEEAKAGHEIEEAPAVVENDEAIVQMEEIGGEDNVDDMWADAMNEQAAESSNELQKTEEQDLGAEGKVALEEVAVDQQTTDKEAQEPAQVEDINAEERVEDMWADAMNEQAAESSNEGQKTEEQDLGAEGKKTLEEVAVDQQTTDKEAEETAQVEDNDAEESVEVNVETELSENEEAENHALDEEPQLAMTNTSAETQTQEHESKASMPDADESNEEEIGDMWEAALDEQVHVDEAINKTTSADLDNVQEEAGLAEGNSEKDADQIWAEALSNQAESDAGEEKLPESKTDQEESPGASR